jgi:hypothetical protein
MMTATAFVLWVLVAGAPTQQRGRVDSYTRCTEAAIGEVDSLEPIQGRPVRWECVPSDLER